MYSHLFIRIEQYLIVVYILKVQRKGPLRPDVIYELNKKLSLAKSTTDHKYPEVI